MTAERCDYDDDGDTCRRLARYRFNTPDGRSYDRLVCSRHLEDLTESHEEWQYEAIATGDARSSARETDK